MALLLWMEHRGDGDVGETSAHGACDVEDVPDDHHDGRCKLVMDHKSIA